MTAPSSVSPRASGAATVSIDDALRLAWQQFHAGNYGEVEAYCTRIFQLEPENPEALHLLGVTAHLADKQGLALAMLEKAARLAPGNSQFQYNLGVVLGTLRLWPRALECYRLAAALNPQDLNARINLGNAALEADQLDEALAAYTAALAASPGQFNVVLAKAIALYAARRFADALPFYAEALALAPADARAHWELAQALLMTRDYERGWREYEYRFAAGAHSRVWCYPYAFPRWCGEALSGRSILLHAEQGLGDELMFASIYPEIVREAQQVILCSDPCVAPLLRDSFPGATVIDQSRADEDAWTRLPAAWVADWQRRHGPIDYQIVSGSLPALRRAASEKFPAHSGYLKSDPSKVAQWRRVLAHLENLKVGLCWAANPSTHDHAATRRSRKKGFSLHDLAPLSTISGVSFVSLQTWDAAHEAADAPLPVLDCSAGLNDFSETAALIENLDLVVTCDTSVAHLAGGLGKPVWILLPWQSDWRWHAEGDTTPWYPSAKLYRQPAPGDWAGVVQQIFADLAVRAHRRME